MAKFNNPDLGAAKYIHPENKKRVRKYESIRLTNNIELCRSVCNVTAVSCNAGVASSVFHADVMNDKRAVGHLLESE